MFEILRETFKKLKGKGEGEKKQKVIFTTLHDYVRMFSGSESSLSLPEVEFDKLCWAPEIHGELRVDGLYLPLGVKRYRNISGSEIYNLTFANSINLFLISLFLYGFPLFFAKISSIKRCFIFFFAKIVLTNYLSLCHISISTRR